jgi:hypothetical protein
MALLDQEVLRCPDCRHHVDERGKRCICDSWADVYYYYIFTGQYLYGLPLNTTIHPCPKHEALLEEN